MQPAASRGLPTLNPRIIPPQLPLPTDPFFLLPDCHQRGGCRVCRKGEQERERCLLLLACSLMHKAQVEVLQREKDGACVCLRACVSAIFDESTACWLFAKHKKFKFFLIFLQPVVLYVVCLCVRVCARTYVRLMQPVPKSEGLYWSCFILYFSIQYWCLEYPENIIM